MKAVLMIVLFMVTLSVYSQNTEEESIIKLLVKESTTWRNGDRKEHAKCWLVRPYSKVYISSITGDNFEMPAEKMANPTNFGSGTFENSNYNFSIHNDNAWVSHDEVSTDVKGNKSYSHEIKMLEKVNNEWKIVAISIHMYKK